MTFDGWVGLFVLVSGIGLILLGMVTGRIVEAAHFRSLARREAKLTGILISDLRRLPDNWHVEPKSLVTGTAVIASDRAKVFFASLRNLVGGRVKSYETLMERARREALLRLKVEAQSVGANAVWNVRLETATIASGVRGGGIEVIAYGTALRVT